MHRQKIKVSSEIGVLVRQYRTEHDLTQAMLAKRLGVSRKWVLELESGKVGIRLDLVLKALDRLGINLIAETPPLVRPPPSRVSVTGAKQEVVMEHFVNNAPSAKDQLVLDNHHQQQAARKERLRKQRQRFYRAIAADFRRCAAAGMSATQFVRTRCKGRNTEGRWLDRHASQSTIRRAISAFEGVTKPR